jgi:hypothetical protein
VRWVPAIVVVLGCDHTNYAPPVIVDSADSSDAVGDDANADGANGVDALGVDTPVNPSTCTLVIPQTGCTDNTACYIDIDTIVQDCLAAGSAAENAHCTNTNDCEPGTGCANVDGDKSCHRYCNTTADCTGGPGSICQYNIVGTNANVCSASCDPDANTGCASSAGCRVFYGGPGGTTALTECGAVGTATQGQLCLVGGDGACAGGYACVSYRCEKICKVAANDCTGGKHCVASAPAAIINGINYGVCE